MARHGKGGLWASRDFGFIIMYRVPELAQGLGGGDACIAGTDDDHFADLVGSGRWAAAIGLLLGADGAARAQSGTAGLHGGALDTSACTARRHILEVNFELLALVLIFIILRLLDRRRCLASASGAARCALLFLGATGASGSLQMRAAGLSACAT